MFIELPVCTKPQDVTYTVERVCFQTNRSSFPTPPLFGMLCKTIYGGIIAIATAVNKYAA